ncbi:hypothetical protein FZEAL_7011 [Fusarium zealandicum]|uniref:Alpha-1,3-mannosyltransferase CMT1 n=1 Tax=Fusarium zealandicum TaxID=1053134 RepID=A0A8H4XI96_9HYPO|nr:hypothetical protein FZEAL_7011 [Fusarium zealandicum]
MHRKLLVLIVPTLCFLLVATSLYLGRQHLTRLSNLYLPLQHAAPATLTTTPTSTTITTTSISPEQTAPSFASSTALSSPTSSGFPILNGTVLSAERISPYVSAILDPAATDLPRLECPAPNAGRYDILREPRDGQRSTDQQRIDYFFALNLRECVDILPRLMGSIIETVRFLGPHRCALSIVEGNSPDGTADILTILRPFLEDIGLVYFYNRSNINPSKGSRIQKLAQLRNLALTPLYKEEVPVSEDTTVLFINDVAACTEDILELALQRRTLGADMTCAMDWTYVGADPTFYDIWVARSIESGESFFEVGSDGNWNSAWNLFWNAPQTRARYDAYLPFQVFSCWNGATAFTAAPLLHGLRFRDVRGDKGECFQGEPQLFCKDLWSRGYRKIAVVPTVNLEYSDEKGADIKRLKGYVSQRAKDQDEDSNKIDWVFDPPEKVKCMPDWEHQSWRPWNETLR